ncbi:MAG TPA: MerR family transcriptional regulator [Dongiaceae bacterium]|nr:MerR family transcriptional regulator [Dongiaceae bacterium]
MKTDNSEQYISIGNLAKTIGVTTRTLRYYEEMGIMSPPQRLEGAVRVYAPADVRKLKFILRLKELGLSIKEMQELDAVYIEARETDRVIPRLIEMLDKHVNNLDEKMSKLASLRKEIIDYRQRMIKRFQLTA